uniref:Uncharacterized protein n=1 Tax=Glossina pallidipes TaxID=7398 RepID=A0A1A9ZA50_GLOPL
MHTSGLKRQAKEGSKSAMFFYPNNQTGFANHSQTRLKLTFSDFDNDSPWPSLILTLKANFTLHFKPLKTLACTLAFTVTITEEKKEGALRFEGYSVELLLLTDLALLTQFNSFGAFVSMHDVPGMSAVKMRWFAPYLLT